MKALNYLTSFFIFSAAITHAQDYLKELTPKEGVEEKEKEGSNFIDSEDGYFDIGSFLDKPYGFYPMVMPITEPAVGYGAALVPVFIKRPEGQKRPNFYAAGAMKTENGTEALFAAYSAYHFDERLKLDAAFLKASVNLDFYGSGAFTIPSDTPLRYNLDTKVFILGGDWKLRDKSPWSAGLKYAYADVNASLKSFPGSELLPPQLDLSALGKSTPFSRATTQGR